MKEGEPEPGLDMIPPKKAWVDELLHINLMGKVLKLDGLGKAEQTDLRSGILF